MKINISLVGSFLPTIGLSGGMEGLLCQQHLCLKKAVTVK